MKTTTQSGQAWRGYERAQTDKVVVAQAINLRYKKKKMEHAYMKFLIKILVLILLVTSGVWFWFKPGFDSGIAIITALIMLLGLFVSDKLNIGSLKQIVSKNSCGIQAGGNVSISIGKEKK